MPIGCCATRVSTLLCQLSVRPRTASFCTLGFVISLALGASNIHMLASSSLRGSRLQFVIAAAVQSYRLGGSSSGVIEYVPISA